MEKTSRNIIHGMYAIASAILLLICFGVVYRNTLVSLRNTCDFGCSLNLLFIVYPAIVIAVVIIIAWASWSYFKIKLATKFLLMGIILNITGWWFFVIYATSKL